MAKEIKGISKTKTGYKVDKIYKGFRIQRKFSFKIEAQEFLTSQMNKIDERENENLAKIKNLTLNEAFESFIKYNSKMTEATKTGYINKWIFNFKSNIGKTQLIALSDLNIIETINEIKKRAKKDGLSTSYENRLYTTLKTVLVYCLDKGYISNKQANIVDLNNSKKSQKMVSKEKEDFLTKAQLNQLKTVLAEESKNELLFVVDFLSSTGCRISEARALKYSDLIKINNSYCFKINKQLLEDNSIEHFTKTGTNRTRPITNGLADELLKRKELFHFTNDDYILRSSRTHLSYTRKYVNSNLKIVIEKLKNDGKLPENFPIVTCHGFRRTNVNVLLEQGLSPLEVAKINGHSLSTMEKYYVRQSKSQIEEIADKLNNF